MVFYNKDKKTKKLNYLAVITFEKCYVVMNVTPNNCRFVVGEIYPERIRVHYLSVLMNKISRQYYPENM